MCQAGHTHTQLDINTAKDTLVLMAAYRMGLPLLKDPPERWPARGAGARDHLMRWQGAWVHPQQPP